MPIHICLAETDDDLARCSPVMRELRPHLTHEQFMVQAKRQNGECGYQLAFLTSEDQVCCVAGFRMSESLAWGRYLYVDDLVTAQNARSRGYGGQLLDWLAARAATHGCEQFHLDSGVQRFDAHRFYLDKRLNITSHHFARTLSS